MNHFWVGWLAGGAFCTALNVVVTEILARRRKR